MTYHSQDYHRPKWNRWGRMILRLGERCGVRYSSAIISVSGYLHEHIVTHYRRQSVQIPNGVEIPPPAAPGETLERFGLVAGEYVLGVGRLVKEKGFHDLIPAYKAVPGQWPLVIVGDADHESPYSRELKRQGAEDARTVMTGFLTGTALREIYANAGLFVSPSYHEGLPIVLLEAMSYGLPVLVSDIPPHLELMHDPQRIFPVGDQATLGAKMGELLESPADPALAETQIRFIRERFDWDRVAEETRAVYRSVLNNR
jgi:glycosyltransferase involved in cell wall biosynthesis